MNDRRGECAGPGLAQDVPVALPRRCDGFCPLGKELMLPASSGPGRALATSTHVNGGKSGGLLGR